MTLADKYIEMCTRNMDLKHPVPAHNEAIVVFDMDDCLFQSNELAEYEKNHIKNSYLQLSNSDEETWIAHLSNFNLYREIFHSTLKMDLLEFSEKYERPKLEEFVKPDTELKSLLEKIKIRRFCFTNACRHRAKHVLNYLQLEDVLEAVICTDIVDTEFICKPQMQAYKFLERYLSVSNPKNIYFFDDSLKNIEGAGIVGWNTIHVCEDLKKHINELSTKVSIF